MACKMTRERGGSFTAPIGSKITIDIRSDQPAETVRIIYGGEQDGETPFEFRVKGGKHALLVVALGAKQDQRMTLVELSGQQECALKRFTWSSTHFHTAINVEGA